MYELLSSKEVEEFKNTIEPVIKRNTKITPVKEEIPFNLYVGKVNRVVNDTSLIMTGIFSSYSKSFIVKFLKSINRERIKDEQGAFVVFCELVLEKFIQMAKDKDKNSILIHTSDLLMLEVLINSNFEITKTKNDFYKAFKVLQK